MSLARIVCLARMLSGEYLKLPLAFVSDLIIPLVLFVIVQLSTGKGVESLIGILIAFAWAAGAFTLSRKLAVYRMYRLLDVFIASPVTQLEFAIAAALAHLVVLVVPALVILVLIVVLQGGASWSMLVLVGMTLAAWFLGIVFGLFVFNKMADPVKISSLANLMNLALIMLPPVIYPIELLPEPLRLVSLLVPTVDLKVIAMYAYGMRVVVPLLPALVLLLTYYVVFTVLAVRSSSWGE